MASFDRANQREMWEADSAHMRGNTMECLYPPLVFDHLNRIGLSIHMRGFPMEKKEQDNQSMHHWIDHIGRCFASPTT